MLFYLLYKNLIINYYKMEKIIIFTKNEKWKNNIINLNIVNHKLRL